MTFNPSKVSFLLKDNNNDEVISSTFTQILQAIDQYSVVGGPQGTPGPQGATGSIGLVGPMGLPGSDGVTGPQGATGPVGSPGIIGIAGMTINGQPGMQGATGIAGDVGPPGVQGPDGNVGPTGDFIIGATGNDLGGIDLYQDLTDTPSITSLDADVVISISNLTATPKISHVYTSNRVASSVITSGNSILSIISATGSAKTILSGGVALIGSSSGSNVLIGDTSSHITSIDSQINSNGYSTAIGCNKSNINTCVAIGCYNLSGNNASVHINSKNSSTGVVMGSSNQNGSFNIQTDKCTSLSAINTAGFLSSYNCQRQLGGTSKNALAIISSKDCSSRIGGGSLVLSSNNCADMGYFASGPVNSTYISNDSCVLINGNVKFTTFIGNYKMWGNNSNQVVCSSKSTGSFFNAITGRECFQGSTNKCQTGGKFTSIISAKDTTSSPLISGSNYLNFISTNDCSTTRGKNLSMSSSLNCSILGYSSSNCINNSSLNTNLTTTYKVYTNRYNLAIISSSGITGKSTSDNTSAIASSSCYIYYNTTNSALLSSSNSKCSSGSSQVAIIASQGSKIGANTNSAIIGCTGGTYLGSNDTVVVENLLWSKLTNVSDKREKKNIIPAPEIPDLLERVKKVNSYQFRFKKETPLHQPHIGFIAQELGKEFPMTINESKDPEKMLSINFKNLGSIIWMSLQELIKDYNKNLEELKNIKHQIKQKLQK